MPFCCIIHSLLGKTLAYLLPILAHLLQQDEKNQNVDRKIQALILAPTRELALQVQKECNKLLPGLCGTLVGGMSTHKQERVLRQNKPHIIIATPGRLWEMVRLFPSRAEILTVLCMNLPRDETFSPTLE